MNSRTLKQVVAVIALLFAIATSISLEAAKIDAKAVRLLKAMSDKLSAAKEIRFVLRRTVDVGLFEGVDVTETVRGEVYVRRPNKLAARITTKGHRRQLVYDGARISILDLEAKRFATVPAPGAIDKALTMLEEDYEYAPPLADFLFADPYGRFLAELESHQEELESGEYAGLEDLAGDSVHHLAFREQYVDWDLWLSKDDLLPRRFVITATGIEGNPKIDLEFLRIELNPKLADRLFVFAAPAGARKIPMPKVSTSEEETDSAATGIQPPKMRFTTDIPASVMTPDTVKTERGTLKFVDGVPTEKTAKMVWDQLDFQRAVECMIMCTPAASLNGFRRFMRECGPDNETMVYWHGRMDSKVLILTPNTTVVYTFMWIDLKDGPLVMETPPNVLGIIDNAWFHYVTDFGNAGPDKGKGGKYLLLPPDYEGEIPDGYIVKKSETYGHWLAMRGFMTNFEANPVVDNMKKHFKLYPLGSQPKGVNWVDCAGKEYDTLHAQDATFFNEVNEVVQEEPASAWDSEVLGMLAEIGIRKGQPFNPDARMQKILADAAAWGTAAQRTIIWRNRNKNVLIWPDSKSWEIGFAGGSHEFANEGIRLINERVRFHYYATGITPVMVRPPVGKGSQYVIGLRDEKGNPLDGSKTYRIHVPPKVPAERFWDITVYDNQTRSLIQTDEPYPGVTSSDPKVAMNADGTCDVYIGPKRPAEAKNWIQTIPGKGLNILWRIYSPTQVWYDKTWRPGEIELVK